MTARWRWVGLIAPIAVWTLLGAAHRIANVRPGRVPSIESAVLLLLSGMVIWLIVGALVYAFASRIGHRPLNPQDLFATWGLAQIPLGVEGMGALLMLDPSWPQTLGYMLAVFSLIIGFPIGVIVFLIRGARLPWAWAVVVGLVGSYLWIVRVWAALMR